MFSGQCKRLRRLLVIHAFVASKLDYCNSLLYGQPKHLIKRLPSVQNFAARIIFQCRKYDHVTPLLKSLHWLPIEQRIKFKLLIITFKDLKRLMPPCICDLVTLYVPTRTLRSADQSLLFLPKLKLKTFGARSFYISAHTQNSMPLGLRKIDSYSTSKKHLKTWLFTLSFSN